MILVDQFIPLLALCARWPGHPTQYAQLRRQAQALADWDAVPAYAEAHGLVPLLYTHLQAARIDVLLLKGAALGYLIYPQPVLRPMRDIDILVLAADVYRAYSLLPQIGFTPSPGAHDGIDPNHHHLTAIKRFVDGVSVSVEVHHALHLNEKGRPPQRFEAFARTAQPVMVGTSTAQTLGREETLWHIYRHTFCMPVGYEPLRLIWVADLISLVEAWVDGLDWERVRRQYGAAYRILPLLHSLSPWSDAVLERLKLPVACLPAARAPAIRAGRATHWLNNALRASKGSCVTASSHRRGGCECITARDHRVAATGGPGSLTSAGSGRRLPSLS